MKRKLTIQAKEAVLNDAKMYADICLILKVKAGSLSQLIYRDSASLLNHDVVKIIADKINKKPEAILEFGNDDNKKTKVKKTLLTQTIIKA